MPDKPNGKRTALTVFYLYFAVQSLSSFFPRSQRRSPCCVAYVLAAAFLATALQLGLEAAIDGLVVRLLDAVSVLIDPAFQ